MFEISDSEASTLAYKLDCLPLKKTIEDVEFWIKKQESVAHFRTPSELVTIVHMLLLAYNSDPMSKFINIKLQNTADKKFTLWCIVGIVQGPAYLNKLAQGLVQRYPNRSAIICPDHPRTPRKWILWFED